MAQIEPYLNFPGNCEEALNHYKKVFNGEITFMQRYADAPMEVPEDYRKRIIHANFYSGDIRFMGCDIMPGDKPSPGSAISLYINCDDEEQQDKYFNALSEGGKVEMPLENAFWGSRFGMVRDKFGITWMLGYDTRPMNN